MKILIGLDLVIFQPRTEQVFHVKNYFVFLWLDAIDYLWIIFSTYNYEDCTLFSCI